MYLRCPQLHAHINLQRAWETFPLQGRRYFHDRPFQGTVQQRTIIAQSSSSAANLIPKIRHWPVRKFYTQRPPPYEGSTGDGSGTPEDSRIRDKPIKISSCYSTRTFATSTGGKRSSRGETFKRNTHSRPPVSEMTVTAAARKQYYFQFITTPTSDTHGTTLLLHFDSKRYIFGNISEGTQRACIQRSIGLKNVRNIFLTGQVKWRNTGGLIGMILNMADTQVGDREAEKIRSASKVTPSNDHPSSEASAAQRRTSEEGSLTIHGGEQLLHTVACARRFVFRKSVPIFINEFEFTSEVDLEEPTWKDENVRIWAMSIAPAGFGTPNSDNSGNLDVIPSSREASPGARSRRKRKHHLFEREDEEAIARNSPDQHLQDQALRRSIVSDMFNSEWDRGNLFEVSLADVKMPAALFVRDPVTKKITSYIGPRPGGEDPLPDIKVLVRDPWPGARLDRIPPARDIGFKPAMSYIVQGYPQRGKFDMQRAKALGVPRGPLYSSLVEGNHVTLEDGTIITPEMVLGPVKPGRAVAIVDLPSSKYVSNLIGRPEWTSEQTRNGIVAICWILGPGVASDGRLKSFMESIPNVEHIISSLDICSDYLAFDSSAASAIRLSRVSKRHFPVPVHDNITLPQLGGRITSDNASLPQPGVTAGWEVSQLPGIVAAKRGLIIQVESNFCMNEQSIPPFLNTADVVESLPEKVRQYACLAQEKIAAETKPLEGADPTGYPARSTFDPEIITLGTGSAMPSKYRNVSATLLRTGKYGDFLFDCGENTMGQLRRVFDPSALHDVLRNLKFVWISHLHADHHLGSVSVLAAHESAFSEDALKRREQGILEESMPRQIVVASDARMHNFLEDYESVETFAKVHRLYCGPMTGPALNADILDILHERLGIRDLKTTGVDHCAGAQAISITFNNGFKFSYSGDCRPSLPFAYIGKGSDVLVHEATFDDDMEGDALAKKHCTTGEALGVAAKMEAKNVILTHFSQRYQKLPVMENMKLPSSSEESATSSPWHMAAISNTQQSKFGKEREKSMGMAGIDASRFHVPKWDMNICVAFDYMRIRVSEIKHMKSFTPALAALFEAEETKSGDEDVTPQERSELINRTKGSKKSHPKAPVV